MKRLFVVGGLLAGLSGCMTPEHKLEEAVKEVPTLEIVPPATGFEENFGYYLGFDEKRLLGLRDFYLDSRDYNVREGNVLDNLVLLEVGGPNGGPAHGYLINDCGLVLTNSHVAESLNQYGSVNGKIITRDGEVYPIRRTELDDEFLDFAIVSAETGKEPKTHPLNFIDTTFSPCGFNASFTAVDFMAPEDRVYNPLSGNVWCVFDMIQRMDDINWGGHQGVRMGMLLRKGSVFLDIDSKYGYSGSPVFSDIDSYNPIFLGLVRSGLFKGGFIGKNPRIPNKELMSGFTAITTSTGIRDGIGDYLREQGVLDASMNIPR